MSMDTEVIVVETVLTGDITLLYKIVVKELLLGAKEMFYLYLIQTEPTTYVVKMNSFSYQKEMSTQITYAVQQHQLVRYTLTV